MSGYPESMKVLIEEFARMPGVGVRTAERLAFYVLTAESGSIERLANSIRSVNESIRYCVHCYNLSELDECSICADPRRDKSLICVVAEPKDIITIEKAGVYRGFYHVLLGVLSPLDAIGPKDLRIDELVSRIRKGGIEEVLIATTSDTEGEATAIYLKKVLKPLSVKVTRLAQGIPVGSDLEFTDRATLMYAIESRNEI
jgi:recombination protein RecR